jgi:HK97 family phage major capsid protein
MSAILEKINEFGEAVVSMRKAHDEQHAALLGRVEEIESKDGRPRGAGPRDGIVEYKIFRTDHGDVYELPARTRLQDVPEFRKQQPPVSYERWLHAAMAGERCGDKEALEYAREQKQMVTTTTGVLIPQEYIPVWIDNLRAQMVLSAAGISTAVMNDKKQIRSAVTADPASTWHSEAGSISPGNPTFAARELNAQTLVTRCQGSVELAADAPDFGGQLATVMARSMAAELDRVGLEGSGTPPEPHGILATSGVNQVTAIGAPTDYSKFLEGVKKLLESGVPLEIATANVIMNPATWAKMEGLATGISSDKTQLPRPRSLEKTRFLVTSSIPASGSPLRSDAFMGDFRDLLLGVRREASVELVRTSDYAGKLVVDWVGYGRFDFVVTRPKSFCTLEAIAT